MTTRVEEQLPHRFTFHSWNIQHVHNYCQPSSIVSFVLYFTDLLTLHPHNKSYLFQRFFFFLCWSANTSIPSVAVPLCLVSPPWEQISGVSGRLPQCAVGWETVRRLDQLGGCSDMLCSRIRTVWKREEAFVVGGWHLHKKDNGGISLTRAAVDLRVPERRLNPKCL